MNFCATETGNTGPVVSDTDHAVQKRAVGPTRSSTSIVNVTLEDSTNRSVVVASDWQLNLRDAFPSLFSSMLFSGAFRSIECGPGWHDVIFRCCTRIDDAVADRENFRFEQIRERQGLLRFYWGGCLSAFSETEVRLAIDLAEARSHCLCEVCGERGQLHRHKHGVGVRCSAHADGGPVPVKPGFENMHLRHKAVVGRIRTAVCSFYDFDRDAFVDVGPR